ncbi:MAG: hypothetical protein HYV52_02295 [Parcubacteria group bacterium]|nr:hypothetical protein [Parcubacteria group bacterium]
MTISRFYLAISILVGAIVGVGIFSLPYLASQAGFFVSLFWLTLLALVSAYLHLMYGEIILRTGQEHRFPGYVRYYLGKIWGLLSSFSTIFGLWLSQLVYIIVGAGFLELIFKNFVKPPPGFWAFSLFILGAFFIYLDITRLAKGELFFNFFLILIFFLIFLASWSLIRFENFYGFSRQNFFLPYGATLFTLTGLMSIAEVKEVLAPDFSLFKKAIKAGIFISALISLIFLITVLGVSGNLTSENSIAGLEKFLPRSIIALLSGFGFLAVFTSFLTTGFSLKKVFWYDWAVPKNLSFFFAVLPPIIFYFSSFKNFIEIISFSGTIFLGFDALLLLFIYRKSKTKGDRSPEYSLRSSILPLFIGIILVLGVLAYFFKNPI